MKKIRIGIPRALHYYRNGVFWKTFFDYLGCKVILSPETNQEIINLFSIKNFNSICLPYKIYLGHIIYLKEKCDYILINEICNYSKKEKVCQKHQHIIDDLKDIINKDQILKLHIDHKKMQYQLFGLIRIALKITKNPVIIIYSYIKAKQKQKKYNITKQNENKNKLLKPEKKVLLVSNFYNLHDKYIMSSIINTLKLNNIIAIYSNYLDYKTATFFSPYFSNNLKYKYYQETMGSLYYYKYQVDGIIIISDKYCNTDSIISKKAIEKNVDIPLINLVIGNQYMNNKKLSEFIKTIK